MIFTMNGIFVELCPHIPDVLVSPDIVCSIHDLNGKIPAALSSRGIIECHLGISGRAADWQLCVEGKGSGRDIAAGNLPLADIDKSFFTDPSWRHLRRFSRTWADPSSHLYRKVDHIWLEFDHAAMSANIPVPGVYFSVGDANAGHSLEEQNSHTNSAYRWLTEAIELLQGSPLKKETSKKLFSCLETLPGGGELHYAAVKPFRQRNVVRIVLTVPVEKLEPYLALINCPCPAQEIVDAAKWMERFGRVRYLFDIADTVLPVIGIECRANATQDGAAAGWESLLDRLLDEGLCTPEKHRAFLSWTGVSAATLPCDIFPCYIIRNISHVKLVFRAGGHPEAKGYLDFMKKYKVDVHGRMECVESTF
jgi:hypothetical protein